MSVDHDISLGTLDDIPGIVALQELNLPHNRGSLSVRLPADWFRQADIDKLIVIGRRCGNVVGYVLETSLAAQSHIPIIQTMMRTFPAPPDCYLYGPVCVAESERGKGLAGAMFEVLQANMQGRSAMTFVRADNAPSLRAHRKKGHAGTRRLSE